MEKQLGANACGKFLMSGRDGAAHGAKPTQKWGVRRTGRSSVSIRIVVRHEGRVNGRMGKIGKKVGACCRRGWSLVRLFRQSLLPRTQTMAFQPGVPWFIDPDGLPDLVSFLAFT